MKRFVKTDPGDGLGYVVKRAAQVLGIREEDKGQVFLRDPDQQCSIARPPAGMPDQLYPFIIGHKPAQTVLEDFTLWRHKRGEDLDRKSARLNSSHVLRSRMPSSA